jgi:hypothetical protein
MLTFILTQRRFSFPFEFLGGEIEGEEEGLLGFVLLSILGRMEMRGKMLQGGDSIAVYLKRSY